MSVGGGAAPSDSTPATPQQHLAIIVKDEKKSRAEEEKEAGIQQIQSVIKERCGPTRFMWFSTHNGHLGENLLWCKTVLSALKYTQIHRLMTNNYYN